MRSRSHSHSDNWVVDLGSHFQIERKSLVDSSSFFNIMNLFT